MPLRALMIKKQCVTKNKMSVQVWRRLIAQRRINVPE